jgi:hypothetical protein
LFGGGFEMEKHTKLGLIFPRPKTYEQIPRQPGERWIVLYYAEEIPKDPSARRTVRPELRIVSIDGSGDKITDLDSYFEQQMPGWTPADGRVVARRAGLDGREREMIRSDEQTDDDKARAGWLWSWEGEGQTLALIGFCAPEDLREQSHQWRTTARKMRITTPRKQTQSTAARLYTRGTLRDPEFRIAVRDDLVRGWRAEDTVNYIVIYDTTDVQLVRQVARDIELMRKEYEKLFPPVEPISAVATVRVCKDRDEYLAYGGRNGSAGFWNSGTKELVLYDAGGGSGGPLKNGSADTLIVLYHEAFHQYIHYSAGQLAPHPWFDEGHGDYFSGAEIRGGRMRSIGPNPWRFETIQDACAKGEHVAFKDILRFEQDAYYADSTLHYAQGWAMVYFLRESKEVRRRREWASILPTYFETLKRAYPEELMVIVEEGLTNDIERLQEAGELARVRALDEAIDGVDLIELENAWLTFVSELQGPRY